MPKYIHILLGVILGLIIGFFAKPAMNHLLYHASSASGNTTIPYRIVPAGKFINFEYVGNMPTGKCDGPEDNISFCVYPNGIAVCQGGSTWRHIQFDE